MYDLSKSPELQFHGAVIRGATGFEAQKAQEWLTLAGFGLDIDGEFFGISERATQRYQQSENLPVTGAVDFATWTRLTQTIVAAAMPPPFSAGEKLSSVMLTTMRQHLANKPREVAHNNRGPWVRLYMKGQDNDDAHPDEDWNWCAGSVSSIGTQAALALGVAWPLDYQINCNVLQKIAAFQGRFFTGAQFQEWVVKGKEVPASAIFVRKKEGGAKPGYEHTGLAFDFNEDGFQTIEGNFGRGVGRMATYDRGYKACDIILVD